MKKTQPHQPLSEAELDQLGAFLASPGSAGMSLEMLDGYLTSLICGPYMVAPSEFLPEIWGEDFAFASPDQANLIVGLIMRHWNAIADDLHEAPHIYLPILEKDNDGIARANDWAIGFMQGMRHSDWSELIESEEEGGPIVIIMLLAYENDPDPALRPPPIPDDKREEIIETMIAGTTRIYRYFEPRRRSFACNTRRPSSHSQTLKVGRNEPCPCGSGLKYKRCCADLDFTIH